MAESFLDKAMKKLSTNENDKITPQKVQPEEMKPQVKEKEKTVIPTNKAKLMYKQQQLNSISQGGMQNVQQQ